MSDKPPNGNGNHTTIIQAGARLGSQIVNSIGPPQFIVLIILNAVVLAFLFWFVNARSVHTTAVIQQLLDKCLGAKS